MEDNAEKIAGTNLTTVPEYTKTAMGLAELKTRLKGLVFNMADKKSAAEAKGARSLARKLRTELEAERKRIKAPALERCRQIDGEANRITAEIREVEEPIAAQIDAYEAEQEAKRLAELKAEQDRIDGHRARIQGYRDLPGTLIGVPTARLESQLSNFPPLDQADLPDAEEFAQESDDAYQACRGRLLEMLNASKAADAERERQRQRDAEFEAQQEALRAANERAAQLEREAEERRQADLRREREEQEEAERAESRRVINIRQRIDLIESYQRHNDVPMVELQKRLADVASLDVSSVMFDFQEFHAEAEQAWERSLQAINQAIDARETLDREAAEAERTRQAELDRLQKEREEADARAAEAERARAEQAAQAEEERQQSLTFRKAAQALVDWCVSQGHGHVQVVEDMNAMLLVTEGDLVPTKRQPRKPVKVAR